MPSKKPKKKRNRRSSTPYPALDPTLNLKTRYELLDFDYIDKLSDKEKEWLNTFAEEYINANFNHGKKKLHRTDTLKKDCYNRNNARNRDILTRAKASGQSVYLEELKEQEIKLKKFSTGKETNDLDDGGNGSS